MKKFSATINILPLMNKISELNKTTITENENSTTTDRGPRPDSTSPATATISTLSATSATSTTKQKTKNVTLEDSFGSSALTSNFTTDFISPNETATTSNTSNTNVDTQKKPKVTHSELKNCPWITGFGIAFTFIIICCKFFQFDLMLPISFEAWPMLHEP